VPERRRLGHDPVARQIAGPIRDALADIDHVAMISLS
jgi:hypothetical protein